MPKLVSWLKEGFKGILALKHGVHGPRTPLAVNSLFILVSNLFWCPKYEMKASILSSKALRDIGTLLALKMEFTLRVFLGGKLPNLGVLIRF